MFVFFPHDGHLPFLFVNIYTNINALSCKKFITWIAHKLKFCLEIIYLIYEFQLMLFQTYHLDVTPTMPTSPPEKPTHPFGFPHRPYGRIQASWNFVQSWFLID